MKTAFTDFPFFTFLVLMSLSAMNKARTICFVGAHMHNALIGPGWPFLIHCLLILFVSEVWKDTMVSPIVQILLLKALDTANGGNDFLQILILSSFCSNDKSLGTHLTHFLTRLRSSCRMPKIVLLDT